MIQKNEWKVTYASEKGSSHEKNGIPCQDSSFCQEIVDSKGEKVLVAVVSDGAGSAKFSEHGSKLACSLFIKEVSNFLNIGKSVKEIDKSFIKEWLPKYQEEIRLRAKEVNESIREFACTIVAAVVGNDHAAFFQVGDGAIVIRDAEPDSNEENYLWIFWPDNGEFANTTYFITDPRVVDHVQFDVMRKKVEEFSLFTDGIQHLTLHYQTQTVHNPFFKPLFKVLRNVDIGETDKLNIYLSQFLNSSKINEKTDDDKTLLLAIRQGACDYGKG